MLFCSIYFALYTVLVIAALQIQLCHSRLAPWNRENAYFDGAIRKICPHDDLALLMTLFQGLLDPTLE